MLYMDTFLEDDPDFRYNLFHHNVDQLDELFDYLSNYIGHGLLYLFGLVYHYARVHPETQIR